MREQVSTGTRQWLVLGTLCVIRVVIMLDTTALNVAIPAITRELSASTAQAQWVVTSYSLMLAGLLLTTGSLTDRYGRKRALLAGLLLFTGGSVVGAFASSAVQLIVARAVMGVGAALLMPATFAVLMAVFSQENRARAVSVAWGASAVAMVAGPLFGGVLLLHFWWGAVLLINLPIGVAAAVLVVVLVPESRDGNAGRTDPVGALLSVIGAASAVYAVISAGEHGWAESKVLVPLVTAVVALLAFLLWERRHRHPMLDLRLFRDGRFTAAMTEGVLAQFGLSGSIFLFTLYLQFILGYEPLEAGLRVAPMAVTVLLVVPCAPMVMKRFGMPATLLGGLVALGSGIAVLSMLGTTGSYLQTVAGLVLAGVGVSIAMPASAGVLMDAIPPSRAGTAGGLTSTMQEFGSSLGVAVLGSVLAAHLAGRLAGELPAGATSSVGSALEASAASDRAGELVPLVKTTFVDGMATAMQVGAGVIVLAGVVCWLLIRKAGTRG